MKRETKLTRREALLKLLAGGGALSLSGCGLDARSPAACRRARIGRDADPSSPSARCSRRARRSRANIGRGHLRRTSSPTARPIAGRSRLSGALAANGFADWRLEVGGLVEQPLKLSLADLRAIASRTQITRHDCVEGWSCIGNGRARRSPRVLDGGAAEAAGALHRVLLRRHARAVARRQMGTITRPSISSTPSIRRRSSPTR